MVQQGGAEWWQGYQLNDGRYIITDILGYGGFGVVFRAEDTKDNKQVAIKFLRSREQIEMMWKALGNNHTLYWDKLEEDFVKEAMYLKECQHSCIAKYQDIIKTSFGWCIVMEYIDGQDLDSWVRDRGRLSEEEALLYIRQIGDAVTAIHKKGLLHRDIKPKNIMRKADGSEAILIDMGIARQFSPNEWITQTVGWTEGYAPPEQYRQKAKRGAYSDVYALAATLYYLLTQNIPQESRDRQIEDNFYQQLREMQNTNQISYKIRVAIEQGMKLNSNERSQSIEEWFELLPDNSVPLGKRRSSNVSTGNNSNTSDNRLLLGAGMGIVYGLITSQFLPALIKDWRNGVVWLLLFAIVIFFAERFKFNIVTRNKFVLPLLLAVLALITVLEIHILGKPNISLKDLLGMICFSATVGGVLMWIFMTFQQIIFSEE